LAIAVSASILGNERGFITRFPLAGRYAKSGRRTEADDVA